MANNRNRTAGHIFERRCAELLNSVFPSVVTTRSANIRLDGKKVDLCDEDGQQLPINVQCKTTISKLNVNKILESMPDGKRNIIWHKKTKKSKSGRFLVDYYAIYLHLSTYLWLLDKSTDLLITADHFTQIISLPEDEFISVLKQKFKNNE